MFSLLTTGCNQEIKHSNKIAPLSYELIGKNVTVQFDRNALGAAHNLPINPLTGSINGAEVSISGKVEKIDEEWIVLSAKSAMDNNTVLYIPIKSILLVQAHP